jgi:shikimate dehydrogenase
MESIKPNLKPYHNKALVLGTAGSSAAIIFALKQLAIDYKLVSRNPNKDNTIGYTDLNEQVIKSHKLIINTTPLGMYPAVSEYPKIPYHHLTSEHFLYDLIYNPEITQFLEFGKAKNAQIQNGLKMLELQADFSWKIWNHK